MARTMVQMACDECGIEFERQKNHSHPELKHHFCSRECCGGWKAKHQKPRQGEVSPNWKERAIKFCKYCSEPFVMKRKHREETQVYCSMGCSGLDHRGEKGSKWKGGYDKHERPNRGVAVYKEWREEVLARDNWTCQNCGESGLVLAVHHVFSFDEFPEHRLAIWNGVTLCLSCHSRIHADECRTM